MTQEEACELARKTALSMLGSLKRELDDLDRIVAWNRLLGTFSLPVEIEGDVTIRV